MPSSVVSLRKTKLGPPPWPGWLATTKVCIPVIFTSVPPFTEYVHVDVDSSRPVPQQRQVLPVDHRLPSRWSQEVKELGYYVGPKPESRTAQTSVTKEWAPSTSTSNTTSSA